MGYIGDYESDTWFVIEKIYRDGELSEYSASALLDLKEFNDVCEHIKTSIDTYRQDFDTVINPRKSVYILEKDKFKLVIKAFKI